MTACAGTTGTTDTVYIVFTVIWQVIVKDVRHGWNVQATGRHVGRDQNIKVATSKFVENAQAFFLRYVAGQQAHTVTICRQVTPDIFTAVFGVREDNRAIRPLFFDQGLQQAHFLFIRRIEKLFFNAVPGFLLRFYFHIFRIVHLLECEFTYAV